MGKIFEALEKAGKKTGEDVSGPGPTIFTEEATPAGDSPPVTGAETPAKKEAVKETPTPPRTPAAAPPFPRDPEIKPGRFDRNLVTALAPKTFASEQFKQLRTNLLFPKSGGSPRTIMVTSAAPGEGKSFVAANLALSIAQNINEYVLLMDCDMRNPCLHTLFGFPMGPGLTDYLANGRPLASVLLKTGIQKLTLLGAGKPPHNPAELLSSEKMSNLLKEVKNRYEDRYIIIDLPPPNFSAEANALARQVDGIVLVVRYGSTHRDMVAELVEMLGKEKILGVVLNRFDEPLGGGYKYKNYDKYYAGYKAKP